MNTPKSSADGALKAVEALVGPLTCREEAIALSMACSVVREISSKPGSQPKNDFWYINHGYIRPRNYQGHYHGHYHGHY